jgi:hypothetical protein
MRSFSSPRFSDIFDINAEHPHRKRESSGKYQRERCSLAHGSLPIKWKLLRRSATRNDNSFGCGWKPRDELLSGAQSMAGLRGRDGTAQVDGKNMLKEKRKTLPGNPSAG